VDLLLSGCTSGAAVRETVGSADPKAWLALGHDAKVEGKPDAKKTGGLGCVYSQSEGE
jgi:hypothetical protein